ncbi:DUF637 domain-containing protein, partial [Vreelandella olivaria]|uniref:DUF637 domain-containing protein n=1 Tax=Vreelandella olivaria TaxID=390919 RepID=UPI00201E8726
MIIVAFMALAAVVVRGFQVLGEWKYFGGVIIVNLLFGQAVQSYLWGKDIFMGGGGVTADGTGAVSLINQRGDLGAALGDTLSRDSLEGAAIAALSAGATQGMTDHVWGTQTNPTTGATTNLDLGSA